MTKEIILKFTQEEYDQMTHTLNEVENNLFTLVRNIPHTSSIEAVRDAEDIRGKIVELINTLS